MNLENFIPAFVLKKSFHVFRFVAVYVCRFCFCSPCMSMRSFMFSLIFRGCSFTIVRRWFRFMGVFSGLFQ